MHIVHETNNHQSVRSKNKFYKNRGRGPYQLANENVFKKKKGKFLKKKKGGEGPYQLANDGRRHAAVAVRAKP